MPLDSEKLARLFIQLSVFGLVIAVWLGVVTFWWLRRSQKSKRLERRLQFAQQGVDDERVIRLWHDGKAVDAFVPDTMRTSWLQRLERTREDAGWTTPMPRVLAMLATFTIIACVLVWVVSGKWLPVGATAFIIVSVFKMYLGKCVAARHALFEKQLVEALDLGARSLRAGHPLSGAFKLIAQEVGAPVSNLFTEIIEQEALGVSLQKALYDASQRSRSADMKIFATSVVIQLRSGGNLAEMIDRVAWVVRERMRLSRRARVLTAEANLSKWVLIALPVGMFLILNLLNPEYMQPFFNTFAGSMLLLVAGVMLGMGAWLMSQMAKLKY
jgi:tight adherence protein B